MPTIDAQGNLHDGAGQFTEKVNTAPAGLGAPSLADQTPVDIDEALSDLDTKLWEHLSAAEALRARVEKYTALADGARDRFPGRADDYARIAAKSEAAADEQDALAVAVREQIRPYDEEFRRRGGWTRAFVVAGGHVHKSMSCSTCYASTRFAWLPQLSGADEDQIVEAAGERACTVCYPSAPVDVLARPTTLFTPGEHAAAEERRVREEKRAAAAAEKEAKAITRPDGSTLQSGYRRAATLVSAERELTEALMDAELVWPERGVETYDQGYVAEVTAWRDDLIAAIAHKKGIAPDEVRETYLEKARAKYRREYGRPASR